MLGGSITTAWRVLRSRIEGQLPAWRLAANTLNKQPWAADKGWSTSLGVGVGLTTLHRKNKFVTKNFMKPRTWTDSLDTRPKREKMNIRFGLWIVSSLYRAGFLMTVSRELSRYKLDLAKVQEVR
jgi:hypothetical protein